MSTDIYKGVLFNDGEGITHGDLNDAQRFLSAQLYDQVLEKLIGNLVIGGNKDYDLGGANSATPTHLAYCLHGGSGYPHIGTATNKVRFTPGTVLQKIAAADGDEATLLAYTFDGTEEVSITAGHATLARVDLIQMKLELVDDDSESRDFEDATTEVVTTTSMDKKRRVQCTLSVVTGTPDSSPTYPDPSSGYVALAGVVVAETYLTTTQIIFGTDAGVSGGFGQAVVHDQRMPLNVQAYRTDVEIIAATGYGALAYGQHALVCGSVSNEVTIPCPKGGSSGRVVGIDGAYCTIVDVPTVSFIRMETQTDGTTVDKTLNDLTLGTNADLTRYTRGYDSFEAAHNPANGSTVQESAVNKIGPPIWTNGLRCPVPCNGLSVDAQNRLVLKINGVSMTTGHIGDHTWYIAQGI